jgi:cyclopropane fatty-acyl-phospholipid synthase-like methyltransferase
VSANQDARAEGYEAIYEQFDSALMRRIRREAYGEDVGQHSWVSADELRADVARLRLTPESRLLDLGCGPCGPLSFVLEIVGCRGVGLELSQAAVETGRARAARLGVQNQVSLRTADLEKPLDLDSRSFDAAMSLDVVLHLRERARFYAEVARVLVPGGRFLLTDAGVLTGAMSADEGRRRSAHGFAQYVASGRNEALLEASGFRLIEVQDRTESVVRNGSGRLAAVMAHRSELEELISAKEVERQLDYLEAVIDLARRRALSRMMYLAELHAPRAG